MGIKKGVYHDKTHGDELMRGITGLNICEECGGFCTQSVPLIEGLPLVAHNARFDSGCLKAVMQVYRMDYPDYEFYDTLWASRKHFGHSLPNHQLQTVAVACGYDLTNHHHALADAEACAYIAMELL